MTDFIKRLRELQIDLPPAPKPVGSYTPVVIHGSLAFLSGQVSRLPDGKMFEGKVGKDISLIEAQQAARVAALNAVSLIENAVGWDRFDRVLRLVGYVQVDPSFTEIPQVINGASDLLKEIFGDAGIHARSSVGVASLPMNAAVEIELTLALKK